MTTILQVFYALFSAFITATAIPNEFLTFGSPILGLLALVPFYISISNSRTFRSAGWLCSLQMGTVHILTSFWLGNFKDFAIFTLGGSTLVYLVWGYFWGQLLYTPFNFTKKIKLQEKSGLIQWGIPLRILTFTIIWTLFEWYKSFGFLAYPWGTLIMSAYKWKWLTQICAITGTWGLSFLFSLFSAVMAEGLLLLSSAPKQKSSSYIYTIALCLSFFLISTVYGFFEYTKIRTPLKTMNAVLVQTNVDSWTEDPKISIQHAIDLSQEGLDTAAKTNQTIDTVVWSESTLPFLLPKYYYYYKQEPDDISLIQFIQNKNIPFIIGCPYILNEEKKQYCNAVSLFSKDGKIEDWYGKIHLVPFAEGITKSDTKWLGPIMEKLVGFSSSWTQGPKYTLFHLPLQNGDSVAFTTPICFEDAFPDICRALWKQGSEVFINLTNDSWSKTKSAEYQHFVISSYRAIEMRTTLVRSTNAGYTVVVNPAGKVLDSMPLFIPLAKSVEIPIYKRICTTYCLLGDWFPALLFIVLIFLTSFLRLNQPTYPKSNRDYNLQNDHKDFSYKKILVLTVK